ncbi:Ca2+ regulator and membrane fusion protein Fig1-domain-containing protein [Plectosphaerella cucumerina]|uniref:Ca2+ regulator and membrane fusion protein Fig1-domain-containing protein n=1 Tax=Plectosphaerella cucumerina TaxID=40658 RepID=A0A8K0TDP2_9PEZI|nr:Ca2+ regulator and membrane fusion protein Fig1-domain-containing protein [Plectosphaerella cucumerina]
MARFQVGWYRFIPYLGYHHVLMILLLFVVVLLSILIAGCTSESLSGIYLIALSYTSEVSELDGSEGIAEASSTLSDLAANHTSLEIRAGYLGMCLLVAGLTICSRSQETLEAFVHRTVSGDEVGDPLSLIYAAARFRSEVVFVALLFVSVAFAFFAILLLSTFPGWHKEEGSDGSDREVKPFPSRAVSIVSLAVLIVASVLSLLSSFWQHLSSAAASTMSSVFTYGNVVGSIGPAAMALGWVSTFLLLTASVSLLVVILSIRVLRALVDN